ncbi:MAG: thioredoxin, partial [Pseudomonadota bacterium]|jgi:putative thioredoxin
MIDITRATFDTDIIQASMTTPVLVDFWHPKSEQCKIIVPMLEKLEAEYAGRFILAKVDASQEQEIAQAFGVQSIPTCILMMEGKPVDGFQGAVPEDKLKEFLDKHLPPAVETETEEPDTAEFAEITPEMALNKLVDKLKAAPEDETARFDLVKLLMILGRDDDAKIAFAPVIAKTSVVRKFDSLKRWMDASDAMHLIATQAINTPATAIFDAINAKISENKRDFESRFRKTQLLMAQQRWTEAMDELLEILMRDKTWNEDQARKTYIAILDIIEPAPVKVADGQIPPVDATVATYRRRLSSVVLS